LKKYKTPANLSLVVTVLCFAAAYPGVMATESSFTSGPLIVLRSILAGLTLYIFVKTFKLSLKIPIKDALLAALVGQLGISSYQWLIYEGQRVSSAGTAATIINTAPIFAFLGAAFLWKEKIPFIKWLGVFIAFFGIYLLGISGSSQESYAIILLLIAAVALGFYSVFIKPLVNKYHPLVVTFYATIPGAVIFSPTIPDLLTEIPNSSLTGWLGVLALSIIVSGFGYTANSYAVNYLGVSRTVIVYYLVPLVAIIYTAVLFGEYPLTLEYVGVAVVIAGVAIAQSARSKNS
jgi:drug/metabolite transporter (DMT)-like permease